MRFVLLRELILIHSTSNNICLLRFLAAKNVLWPGILRSLSQLTGDPFEEEVCVRLGRVIVSFQPIPRKPHGDGGLDGLSHDGEHAYCCYGPEYDAAKKTKERVDAIVDKFKEDLRNSSNSTRTGRGSSTKRTRKSRRSLPREQRSSTSSSS